MIVRIKTVSANFEPSSYNEFHMLQLEMEFSSVLELSLDKETANIEFFAKEDSITFYNFFFRFWYAELIKIVSIPSSDFVKIPRLDDENKTLVTIRLKAEKKFTYTTYTRTHLVDIIAYFGATMISILSAMKATIFYYQ